MKIGRQFPNHPGGMSHGTLLFYTGASPGGLLSSAKDELKFTSYIRLLKCPCVVVVEAELITIPGCQYAPSLTSHHQTG